MFKMIKNTFETSKAEYKCAKYENEYYTVTLSYLGDYAKDKADNNLQKGNITTICKFKKGTPLYLPTFSWYYTSFRFEVLNMNILSEKDLIELRDCIDIAIESKNEIEEIFYNLFPKEAIK